jgi:hypothetical protein
MDGLLELNPQLVREAGNPTPDQISHRKGVVGCGMAKGQQHTDLPCLETFIQFDQLL